MWNYFVTVRLNDGRTIKGVLSGRSVREVKTQVYAATGFAAVFSVLAERL